MKNKLKRNGPVLMWKQHFCVHVCPFFDKLSLVTPIPFYTHSFLHPFLSTPIPFYTHSFLHPFLSTPIPFYTHSFLHPFLSTPVPFYTHSFLHPFLSTPIPFYTHSFLHPFLSTPVPFFKASWQQWSAIVNSMRVTHFSMARSTSKWLAATSGFFFDATKRHAYSRYIIITWWS